MRVHKTRAHHTPGARLQGWASRLESRPENRTTTESSAKNRSVAAQSGLCLEVENPEVWVYPEGVLDDLTPQE